jgi:hypothetical protein
MEISANEQESRFPPQEELERQLLHACVALRVLQLGTPLLKQDAERQHLFASVVDEDENTLFGLNAVILARYQDLARRGAGDKASAILDAKLRRSSPPDPTPSQSDDDTPARHS